MQLNSVIGGSGKVKNKKNGQVSKNNIFNKNAFLYDAFPKWRCVRQQ